MNAPAKKKPVPRKATHRKPPPPAMKKTDDSDDIERAVYDGMQDLRTVKPKEH
jgi:hypothetical protein